MATKIYCDDCNREITASVPKFQGRSFFLGKSVDITVTVAPGNRDPDQFANDICTICLFELVDIIDPRDKPATDAAKA